MVAKGGEEVLGVVVDVGVVGAEFRLDFEVEYGEVLVLESEFNVVCEADERPSMNWYAKPASSSFRTLGTPSIV